MAFVNGCWFTAGSSGLADFADGTAFTGYRNLAAAGCVNAVLYSYRAVHPGDPSVWEIGRGAYSSGGGTLARTTVSSSSTGAKINFGVAPVVVLTPAKEDLDLFAPADSPTFTGVMTVPDASFTPAKLNNGAAVSLLGRAANSSGARADIAAGANDRMLRRVSDALDFGQLTAGMVANSTLTYAMLASGAIATEAQIKAATASTLLSAAAIWGAADDVLALSDAATVAVDMSLLLALTSVSIAGNRTWGNPTNVKPGQAWGAAVTASGGTRTIAKGSNYKGTGGATWPLSILSGETAYVFFYNWSATIILITGVFNNPT